MKAGRDYGDALREILAETDLIGQFIAGVRDRLIHGYFNVDLKRVWLTARDDVPALHKTVAQMLIDMQ